MPIAREQHIATVYEEDSIETLIVEHYDETEGMDPTQDDGQQSQSQWLNEWEEVQKTIDWNEVDAFCNQSIFLQS